MNTSESLLRFFEKGVRTIGVVAACFLLPIGIAVYVLVGYVTRHAHIPPYISDPVIAEACVRPSSVIGPTH